MYAFYILGIKVILRCESDEPCNIRRDSPNVVIQPYCYVAGLWISYDI